MAQPHAGPRLLRWRRRAASCMIARMLIVIARMRPPAPRLPHRAALGCPACHLALRPTADETIECTALDP